MRMDIRPTQWRSKQVVHLLPRCPSTKVSYVRFTSSSAHLLADESNFLFSSWYYTPDQHIAITGGTQCLDATGGGCGLGGCAPGTEAVSSKSRCNTTEESRRWRLMTSLTVRSAVPVTSTHKHGSLHPFLLLQLPVFKSIGTGIPAGV